MIPRAHITAWRSQAPWPTDAQIEQDLVLTRALTAIFKRSAIANAVAFRYDLWRVPDTEKLNHESVIECFQGYIAHGGQKVTRAQFEENMANKMQDTAFLEDVVPLLPTEVTYQAKTAYELVSSRLIALLPGDPWKGAAS